MYSFVVMLSLTSAAVAYSNEDPHLFDTINDIIKLPSDKPLYDQMADRVARNIKEAQVRFKKIETELDEQLRIALEKNDQASGFVSPRRMRGAGARKKRVLSHMDRTRLTEDGPIPYTAARTHHAMRAAESVGMPLSTIADLAAALDRFAPSTSRPGSAAGSSRPPSRSSDVRPVSFDDGAFDMALAMESGPQVASAEKVP